MYRLVTLAEVKRNLGYDTTDEDVRLGELIEDVSGAILNYLDGSDQIADFTDSSGNLLTDSTGDPATDSNGASVVPTSVRRAAHLMIGALDKDREGETDGFTPAVVSLLARYRDPTVA